MTDTVTLRGYRFSVYTRIARMVLLEKGVAFSYDEVNPFLSDIPHDYLRQHPFGRVPVLVRGPFSMHETAAIARYVNTAFPGPNLEPSDPKVLARMAQVISIIDNYGYRPMVRQVFAHRIFRPSAGEAADEVVIAQGLEASQKVLAALNRIAGEGLVLNARVTTLADLHLAPMIAYFVQAPEGAAALKDHMAFAEWWGVASQGESLLETDPGLPQIGD